MQDQGQQLFKTLRLMGFTLARDGETLKVTADDPALYSAIDARLRGILTENSQDILYHLDAVEVLTDAARKANDSTTAARLWGCVLSYDPGSDEAANYFVTSAGENSIIETKTL